MRTVTLRSMKPSSLFKSISVLTGTFSPLMFLFGSHVVKADQAASAQQILAAFSASCPSQGQWTQNALSQSLSLISVLQTIQADPACQSVNGALSQMQTLSNRVAQLTANSLGVQLTDMQNLESNLLIQLSNTNNPTLQATAAGILPTLEDELASAYSGTGSTSAIRETNALTSFTTGTQLALSQLVSNQSCMLAHPNVLTGIASLAGSVTSGVLSAGASLATAAGTSVINSVVEYVRQHKLQKQINKFSDPTALAAYRCAVESISDNWCAAQDAKNIIDLKEQSLLPPSLHVATNGSFHDSGSAPDFWSGITLMDQELPVFINWLNEVRSGNNPTTQPEGDRQTTEFARNADVQTARSESEGIFNGGLPLFNQKMQTNPPDLQGAWTVERSLIDSFINKIGGSATSQAINQSTGAAPNPLFDIYNGTCAPYALLGLTQPQWPIVQGMCSPIDSFDPFNNWPVKGSTFTPNLNTVIANAGAWANLADATVSAELSLVLQADARSIFQDANDKDIRGRSPLLAIQSFIDFIKAQPDTGNYYADTINRLTQIETQINSVIQNGADPDNSFSRAAISSIYNEAQLAYGPTLFQGRLQRAIRNALNQLVLSGTGVTTSTGAQLLAANDLITQLETISGSSSFISMKSDIKTSQELTEATLSGFGDTFGNSIAKALQAYDSAGSRDTGSDKYKESKASLCLMLLAIPQWPNSIPTNLCIGEQIPADMAGGPTSAKIDASTFALPHQQRACLYRDFMRSSDIYQNYLTIHSK